MRARRYQIAAVAVALALLLYSQASASSEVDDDVPGVLTPNSGQSAELINGYLDAADPNDVYHVRLYPGQRIECTISAADTSDFHLRLFSPEATSIATTEPVLQTEQVPYPRSLAYTASSAAVENYYVVASRVDGWGQYQVTYARSPALVVVDDPLMTEIRGNVGERLKLLGGFVQVLNCGDGELRWTGAGSRPWLTFAPTRGMGTCRLDVFMSLERLTPGIHEAWGVFAAPGAVNSPSRVLARVRVYQPTCVRLAAPTSAPYRSLLSLHVVSRLGKYGKPTDRPDRYATIRFYRRRVGAISWSLFATRRTDGYGRAAVRVAQSRHMQYRVERAARGFYRLDLSNARTVYSRYRVTLSISGRDVPWHRVLTATYRCEPTPPLAAPWGYLQVYRRGRWRTEYKDLVCPRGYGWYPLVWQRPGRHRYRFYVPASNGYRAGSSPVWHVRWHW